jgi:transposase-like protein
MIRLKQHGKYASVLQNDHEMTPRFAMQVSALLAGYDTLMLEEPRSQVDVRARVDQMLPTLKTAMALEEAEPGEMVLQYLTSNRPTFIELESRQTIGQLIADTVDSTTNRQTRKRLHQLGLHLPRSHPEHIAIANNHAGLEQSFAGTEWAHGRWRQPLKQLQDVKPDANPIKVFGASTRVLLIPLKRLLPGQIKKPKGYKTAWFLAHRIREAMRTGDFDIPMGGEGEAVEVDETFIGRKKGTQVRRGTSHKMAVLSLVQRDGGVRSFTIQGTKASEIGPIVNRNVARESFLLTDEAKQYQTIGKGHDAHLWVNHGAGEYVDGPVHTNTIEGFFSIFKRGMKGVYQHCGEKHLHRYLAEFDFRYNNRIAQGVDDKQRSVFALQGIRGKRLTYA